MDSEYPAPSPARPTSRRPKSDSEIVEIVEREVLAKLPSRLSHKTLAKLARIDVLRLERAFIAVRHAPLYSALHRLRLKEANRLLIEESGLPAEAVALRCGFGHYGVFHRSYRRHFGHEPRADLQAGKPAVASKSAAST